MDTTQAQARIAALDARAEQRDFVHDGMRVRWRRFGSGRPLLMLHGGHGSWLHWIANIEPLAEHHELWIADMPGYGDSDDLPMSAFAQADGGLGMLIDAVAGSAGQIHAERGPLGLVGFSFGGFIGSQVAARLPGIERLALLGSAGHDSPGRRGPPMLNWRRARTEEDLHAMMRTNLGLHMLSNEDSIDGLALLAHIGACQRTRFRSKDLADAARLDVTLAASGRPTLLVWGSEDVTATPDEAIASLSAKLPNVRGEVISGAGHWVQFEAADAINRRLLAWFEG